MTLNPIEGDQRDTHVDRIRVDKDGNKFIDVTPTDEGFRVMRLGFEESKASHYKDLRTLDALEAELNDDSSPLWHALETQAEIELLEEAIMLLKGKREDAIVGLERSIEEITTYFKAKGEE